MLYPSTLSCNGMSMIGQRVSVIQRMCMPYTIITGSFSCSTNSMSMVSRRWPCGSMA